MIATPKMQNRSFFTLILMALFMFQSAWNVAAAFCIHETTSNQSNIFHFGHHQALSSCQEKSADQFQLEKPTQTQISVDDHSDHLPSFSHIIVFESFVDLTSKQVYDLEHKRAFLWSNLYQSPDLLRQNPPPLFIPL